MSKTTGRRDHPTGNSLLRPHFHVPPSPRCGRGSTQLCTVRCGAAAALAAGQVPKCALQPAEESHTVEGTQRTRGDSHSQAQQVAAQILLKGGHDTWLCFRDR